MTSAQAFFSQDFESLSEGDAFMTRGRTITEADVVSFASLTGDFHPVHTDAGWAAQSPFGERIAHGMLVLSYAVGLVPLDPERVVALRKIADAVFKTPVRFGDTIHVEGQVTKLHPVDESVGLVDCRWKVLNQDGRTAARVSVEVLWRRGEPAAPAAGELGEAGALR